VRYFIFGAFVGYLSWGIALEMTIISLSLFLAYLLLDKRLDIFLFTLGYYLIASRGLLLGVNHYYHSIFYALLSWASVALLSSLVWSIIWSISFKKRLYLFPLALVLMVIPPIGFISWVNPLPTIAVVLPNFGFLGLMIEMILIYILAISWYEYQKNQHIIIVIFLPLFSYFFISKTVQSNPTIATIDSNINYSPVTFDKSDEYKRIKKFFYLIQKSDHIYTLLPENALGNYSQIQSMIWDSLDKNRTVFAGANIYNYRYSKNINVLMELDFNSSKILYKQRVPVPIEMWKPFSNRGTEATLYKEPIIMINGKKSGVFICYEQLLTYTYLQTFFYRPEMLIGISNLHWATGTNIKTIQKETMQLWSLLFGVLLNFSVNE